MKKLLFNLYFWPAFLLEHIAIFILFPFLLFYHLAICSRNLASSLRRIIRLHGWLIVCVVPFLRPVSVTNRSDRLVTPAILTPNHHSAIDPYLFGALNIENCFVTSWPFKIPFYKYFMHLAGYINSDSGWKTLLDKGRKVLESGSSITIWPEGHRSRDGKLQRFRGGAFRLAVETGYPILPVCILGSGDILPPGRRFLNPGHVEMILLKPIYPKDMQDNHEAATILRKETRSAINSELAKNRKAINNSRHSSKRTLTTA